MPQNVVPLFIPVVIFLLIILVIHRIENRAARQTIYNNFPFFKEAVDSFQMKMDNLFARVKALEKKVNELERKIV
ncbi:MAG: hypothetical protein FJZ13_00465 [Candidatus Omnitrophica bacterium]|nr:hypothetical protein [Candidatus Omnitrophota bacterium]